MKEKVLTVSLNPSIDETIAVEKFVPYGLNRAVDFRMDAGGKGINVAVVLKRFGADVTVTGLAGGKRGKQLLAFLKQDGLRAEFCAVDGETRVNYKIFDRSSLKTTEINAAGPAVPPEALELFRQKLRGMMEEAGIVVLSGSLPPGIPVDFYAQCIDAARAKGKKVILDADGEALLAGIHAVPYAVKPNLKELESISGGPLGGEEQIVSAVKNLLGTGIRIVIVSMGREGAIVAGGGEILRVAPCRVSVKSATGAGDSMVAALAYSLAAGATLDEIAKITTAAAAATVALDGTQLASPEDARRFLPQVELHKIGASQQ